MKRVEQSDSSKFELILHDDVNMKSQQWNEQTELSMKGRRVRQALRTLTRLCMVDYFNVDAIVSKPAPVVYSRNLLELGEEPNAH